MKSPLSLLLLSILLLVCSPHQGMAGHTASPRRHGNMEAGHHARESRGAEARVDVELPQANAGAQSISNPAPRQPATHTETHKKQSSPRHTKDGRETFWAIGLISCLILGPGGLVGGFILLVVSAAKDIFAFLVLGLLSIAVGLICCFLFFAFLALLMGSRASRQPPIYQQ